MSPAGSKAGIPAQGAGPDSVAAGGLAGAESYRTLFTHHPHAVFSLDLEGRYVDANPAAVALCGYSLEELGRMSFPEVICAEDLPEVAAAFREVLAGLPRQLDAHARHRDGRRLDVRITAVPVLREDDAASVVGVHGIAEDVTEANRMRRDVETARRTAELADAAKTLFLANMSHEVRTPLTSVLAAQELLEDLGLEEPAAHLVAMIGRSGHQLLRLVNDLLDFSQLERSGLELVEEEMPLRLTVTDAVEPVLELAAAKGLELTWSVADDVPDRWWGDAFRISQVLTNLLHNAVKFTPQGWVRLVVDQEPGGGLRFDVADTGEGISLSSMYALFQPFTQADASATRTHGGAGLGLAISRDLASLMGGTLGVTSTVGEGSVFSLVVPLRQV